MIYLTGTIYDQIPLQETNNFLNFTSLFSSGFEAQLEVVPMFYLKCSQEYFDRTS